MVANYIRLLRPQQWVKNIFIFAGLIFSRAFLQGDDILASILAFCVFSVLSSGVYIINDMCDYEEDRKHPIKARRTIAADLVKRPQAGFIAAGLIVGSLFAAYYLDVDFFIVGVVYMALMVSYSIILKRVIILDVLIVAIGYVLRAIAGAVVIDVGISSWLLLCTLLIALFLVLSKRRAEINLLGARALEHRKTLAQYAPELLTHMIAIVTAACIVAYCLYTLAPETVEKFGSRNLIITVPFVLYGIFRYLYVSHQERASEMPENIVLRDPPLIICLILWAAICILIVART